MKAFNLLKHGALIVIGAVVLGLLVRELMGGDDKYLNDTSYFGPMTWLSLGVLALIALLFRYFWKRT